MARTAVMTRTLLIRLLVLLTILAVGGPGMRAYAHVAVSGCPTAAMDGAGDAASLESVPAAMDRHANDPCSPLPDDCVGACVALPTLTAPPISLPLAFWPPAHGPALRVVLAGRAPEPELSPPIRTA